MKSKPKELPDVGLSELKERLPKSAAILLRLTVRDKEAITAAAKSLHLTATEYLVKCHEIISEKLGEASR